MSERSSLSWASLVSPAGLGGTATPPPPPPATRRPSARGHNSVRRPIHSADLGSQARLPSRDHPWTLLLSLSPDFCYAKFQQGDLEETLLAPRPRFAFSTGTSGRRRPHCAGRADPVACSPQGQLFPH